MALLSDLLLGVEVRTWLIVILPTTFVLYGALWIVYARTLHPLASVALQLHFCGILRPVC